MTEKTTIDDLIFEIECMAPAGETNGIPYLRLGKADLLHKLNAIKGQSDHRPTFAVGEYYYSNASFVYKMLKVGNAIEPYEVRALDSGDGVMWECSWCEKEIEKDRPATAEQIATFKCAEIKREIGLIIKKGDADWIEIVEDIEEYLAEELQEVENNE